MITHLAAAGSLDAESLAIEGPSYRHLFRSRRLAKGVELRVVDGRGRARWGRVIEVTAERAVVDLGSAAPGHEPTYELQLVMAPPRGERAAWLVEKATELGVAAIRFVRSERAARRYGKGRLERLRRVATAALEQCHGSRLPELSGIHRWEELDTLLGAGDRWFLDTAAPELAFQPAAGGVGAGVIGPEGGWSEAERRALIDAGCRPVGLGPRVLRVETAAIAFAARTLLSAGHRPPTGEGLDRCASMDPSIRGDRD